MKTCSLFSSRTVTLLALFVGIMMIGIEPTPAQAHPYKLKQETFTGSIPPIQGKKSGVDYNFVLANESFMVGVPSSYTPQKSYGLFVYMSPTDSGTFREDWFPVLATRNLLVIAPMRAGNNQNVSRRTGLGVLAAALMQRDYNINPNRIYVAGLSGGARMANSLAFLHPDIFKGALMNCGAGFPSPVPAKLIDKNNPQQTNYGDIVGQRGINPAAARLAVKFAFTTGKKDFRYANILDLYNGGYEANGYNAKLFDVPGMGHSDCDPKTLRQALTFLDG